MKTTGLVKCAGALTALAILSACGGAPAVAPSTAALDGTYVGRTLFLNGRPVTAARLGPLPRYASMLPEPHKSSNTFEYVINTYGSYASIFDYPKSVKQVGTIDNVGGQGCTNAQLGYGKGIIWIVAGQDQVEEFRVPDTHLRTLSVEFSFPTSCAMDTAGDLAIGNYDGGQILILKHASGSGTTYTTPLSSEFFDGYDPQGDLFADGYAGSSFGFVELKKGSKKFVTIKTSNAPEFPGSVQWDGKYVTVFDQYTSDFYQYTISGTNATLKSTVALSGDGDCAETWIVPGLVYCGDAGSDGGEVFKYPSGGSAIAVFQGSFDTPLGVTAARK